MRHRVGPTKRLAPSMDPESSCPHAFVDDEDFQLEIECEQCPGANDLGNPLCLSRAINAACYGAAVDAIVLKRTIHKRYRGGIVHTIAYLASELAAINREIVSSEIPSDRDCRTCPSSIRQILVAAKRSLLRQPLVYADSREAVISQLAGTRQPGRCEKSSECVAKATEILRR